MNTIRIGVYGLGLRGIQWINALQQVKGYEITSIGDILKPRHQRALSALDNPGDVTVHTAYEDMLNDSNVDAIALCVRSETQGAMAAQALESGKHVNAEVPASHTMEDCWRIVAAQEKTGLVYMLAEQLRYNGIFAAWKDMVQEGQLGHVVYCEGEYIGYPGTLRYHVDQETGEFVDIPDLDDHPNAKPTWTAVMDPISYVVHDLSPLLMVLGDRVKKVTAMGTNEQSYAHPNIKRADFQVALMHTEKDTILRMACGYTQPKSHDRIGHRYHMLGTGGVVESSRWSGRQPQMWLANSQMHDMAEVDWRHERTDAPEESKDVGEYASDYYTHAAFRDAILGTRPLEFNVYQAMDTAAPGILAVDSIREGSVPKFPPDFRPTESRPLGQLPTR